jgi:SAM-dependent methyltransferase
MIDNAILNPKSIKHHVKQYLEGIKATLAGSTVIDFPAGSGSTSELLLAHGARVEAYDLFPEYFKVEEIACQRADIMEGIPAEPGHADWVICQEGIEHFSDQLKALKEFNRILKPKGKLLVTVPSYTDLYSKLSYLLFESEMLTNMPQNELTDIWMMDSKVSSEIYHGHIFMIGLQKLRTLARLAGFDVSEIRFVRLSRSSLFLFPIFYPFIVLGSCRAYVRNMKRHKELSMEAKRKVFRQQLMINLNPKHLLNKHTFVVFEKYCELPEVHAELERLAKNCYIFDKVM